MNDEMAVNQTVLQRIADNLGSAVLLFDSEYRLQFMNPAAEMLFAASARHMVGQLASDLLFCTGRDAIHSLTKAVNSGHPITERQMTLTLVDHNQVIIDCTIIPLHEVDQSSGVLVEIQQIDRHVRISREEHLLSQQEAARDLIRGLAHEIKNPLGGLRGAAQLLEMELGDQSLNEYTQIIIDEADRLQSLVDRMLGPNKLPNIASVNVHTLLERVRNLVLAESGGTVEIIRDYDPSIPNLNVDSDRIIQALLNIARNAARAIAGLQEGWIKLKTRILRQFTIGNNRYKLVVQITIEDNGAGIPDEIIEKLFYPMVTASEGGTGLGLSIAQSMINQHRGLIECNSKPGSTAFHVMLPVESENAKDK